MRPIVCVVLPRLFGGWPELQWVQAKWKEGKSTKWPRDTDRQMGSLRQPRSTLASIDEAKWGRGKKTPSSFS